MKNGKIIIGILIICILLNTIYINSLPGLLLMISNILLLVGVITNLSKFTDIFSPISIVFIGLILSFSVKGLYIIETVKFERDLLILPLFYYIIFLGFFMLGFYVKSSNKILKIYSDLTQREIKYHKVALYSLIATLLGFIIFFIRIDSVSISYLLDNLLGNRRSFQNNGGLYYQTVLLLLIQSALYINIIVLYQNKNIPMNKFLILFTFGILFFITFSLGGRGMILIPILMFIFYKYKFSKKVNWGRVTIITITFAIFSGWYGLYRDGVKTGNGFSMQSIYDFFENILNRYVQFDNFIRLVNNPIDFTIGKSTVDFIFSPIPRSIWPDKPYNFNSQMTQYYLPDQFANLIVSDFTMLGELLVNFGVVGLAFGSFIFGLLINYFNKIYIVSKDNFFYFWYPFMILKPMSVLYGGMINSTVNMMILLETPIIIMLWLLYSKSTKKPFTIRDEKLA